MRIKKVLIRFSCVNAYISLFGISQCGNMPEKRPRKKKTSKDFRRASPSKTLAPINAAQASLNQISAVVSQIGKPMQEFQRELQKVSAAGLMWGTLDPTAVQRAQELQRSANAISEQFRKPLQEIQQSMLMVQSIGSQLQLSEYASIWHASAAQISDSFAVLGAQFAVPINMLDMKIARSQLQLALDSTIIFNNSIRLSEEQLDKLRIGTHISPEALKLARPLEGIDKDIIEYEKEAKKWETHLSAFPREDKREEELKQLREIIKQLLEVIGLSKQAAAHWKQKYDDLADAIMKQNPLEDDRDYQ